MHTDGCRQALINYVRIWLFIGMSVVTSISFLLQVVILFLMRYLQTSIALAIKKGDPTTDSVAYILSICLPTDDLTDDKCQRPAIQASVAPSFASSRPPPPPLPTVEHEPGGQLGLPTPSDAGGVEGVTAALCPRVPTGTYPLHVNNSAQRVVNQLPSNRSSAINVPAQYGQLSTPNTASNTLFPVPPI